MHYLHLLIDHTAGDHHRRGQNNAEQRHLKLLPLPVPAKGLERPPVLLLQVGGGGQRQGLGQLLILVPAGGAGAEVFPHRLGSLLPQRPVDVQGQQVLHNATTDGVHSQSPPYIR